MKHPRRNWKLLIGEYAWHPLKKWSILEGIESSIKIYAKQELDLTYEAS